MTFLSPRIQKERSRKFLKPGDRDFLRDRISHEKATSPHYGTLRLNWPYLETFLGLETRAQVSWYLVDKKLLREN